MADQKPAHAAPHIVRIVGRVENVRRTQGREGAVFVHLVKLPAADEFSSPATVVIRGTERAGQQGDKFDQLCQVGGYGRTYQTTDEETGRKVSVQTADNTLTICG